MIWLTWKLLTLPVRLVLTALRLVVRTIRFVGISRIAAFCAGVATGMSLAPTSGAQLRARVLDTGERAAATGGDLGAVVRHELANSPRTWHLPQPSVAAEGNRIILRGAVPHAQARMDLVRTAGAVAGVRAVEDELRIEPGA